MQAVLLNQKLMRSLTISHIELTQDFMMKKLIIAAIFVSVSLSAFAINTIQPGTIHFATEASYPPFEFIDAENKPQGYDIDLANAICKKLEVSCKFTNQPFDSLITNLKQRNFDAIIAGMDITKERQKKVIFTESYYKNSATFITKRTAKLTKISDLQAKRVGVQNGTTHQRYLLDQEANIISVPYDSYQNALLDLKNGRLDAIFGDTAVINQWLENDKDKLLTTVGKKITEPDDYFGTGLGIAIRPDNTTLLNKINGALAELEQNGTVAALKKKWFQR